MARRSHLLISIVLLGAVLEPLARAPGDDDFPLSTYPMFATRKPTTIVLAYAVGVTGAGARRTIAPALVGTREVLQARSILERAVAGGRATQRATCDAIAARVAGDDDLDDVAEIRLVTGTVDAVAYLIDGVPGTEVVHVACPVSR